MFSRDKTARSVQTSTSSQHPRFRRWAARRARQLSIAALVVAGILVVGACGVMLRRATGLIGLPDIGDPFDRVAFRTFRVPEDEDAFALFRQAASKVPPLPNLPMAVRQGGAVVAWSQADPRLRAWFEANRDALDLFRRGAKRADVTAPPLADPLGSSSLQGMSIEPFVWLAFLEASRLEELGDMPAAWDGYQAILRTKAHVMRRGAVFDRYIADHSLRGLESRIATWAANPKTDVSLLHRALNDVHENEPKPEWDAFSLKLDYINMMRMLDEPNGLVQRGTDEDQAIWIAGEPLPPNLTGLVYATRRYLSNEPERSRRVLRLVFANWLAHAQEQDGVSRKPAVRAIFSPLNQATRLSFYDPGPGAPAAARSLSPPDLARWLITTRDAKLLLFQWLWPAIRISERREHSALVILLAEELYRRERGSAPASEKALVGPYVDHLPDDGSSELDDGTAPIIDDSAASGVARPE
jgi:hypothetical protein